MDSSDTQNRVAGAILFATISLLTCGCVLLLAMLLIPWFTTGVRPAISATRPAPTAPADLQFCLPDRVTMDARYRAEYVSSLDYLYGHALDHFASITIRNDNALPLQFRVETELPGFTQKAEDTVTVNGTTSVEVRQSPGFISPVDNPDTDRPVNLAGWVTCIENGKEARLVDRTDTVTVYGRRHFPWQISGFEGKRSLPFVAAWVTPQDPQVDTLIAEAASLHPQGALSPGYNAAPNDEDRSVYLRLEALWNALAQRYQAALTPSDLSFEPGQVETIKLPADTLATRQGDTLDWSLVMASAAEALQLNPVLLLTPGRVYAGVEADSSGLSTYYIDLGLLPGGSFASAVEAGNAAYQANQARFETEERYARVKIQEVRAAGITPIPWR